MLQHDILTNTNSSRSFIKYGNFLQKVMLTCEYVSLILLFQTSQQCWLIGKVIWYSTKSQVSLRIFYFFVETLEIKRQIKLKPA